MAKRDIIAGKFQFVGNPGQLWQGNVMFSNTGKNFYIKVPSDIASKMDQNMVYGDTYEETKRFGEQLYKRFISNSVIETKVIRYQFDMAKPGSVFDTHHIRGRYGIAFTYDVGYKVISGKNEYFYSIPYAEYEAATSTNATKERIEEHSLFERHKHPVYIDWTPEAEDFMRKLCEAIETLTDRVFEFFGEHGCNLLENIKNNSNIKLLS